MFLSLSLLSAFVSLTRFVSHCFTATKLGVFDLIAKQTTINENTTDVSLQRPTPITAQFVAHNLGLHLDATTRLLDACGALNLLRPTGSGSDTEYGLSALSKRFLTAQSSHNLTGYLTHSNELLYPLWAQLEHSVRTGGTAWRAAFGMDGSQAFKNLYQTDQAQQRFMAGSVFDFFFCWWLL
jgi:hypothetical protein